MFLQYYLLRAGHIHQLYYSAPYWTAAQTSPAAHLDSTTSVSTCWFVHVLLKRTSVNRCYLCWLSFTSIHYNENIHLQCMYIMYTDCSFKNLIMVDVVITFIDLTKELWLIPVKIRIFFFSWNKFYGTLLGLQMLLFFVIFGPPPVGGAVFLWSKTTGTPSGYRTCYRQTTWCTVGTIRRNVHVVCNL